MIKFDKLIKRFGWFSLVKLLFYPFTTFVTTPIRLAQTLWGCRVLLEGKWQNYNCFTPHNGINSLCYWTQALNFYKFGRSGSSPYLGLGNYPMWHFFHNSLVSLYLYWGASTITVLLSMFSGILMHLIWIGSVNTGWVLIIIFLAMISTTFYANTFALQNYNALGWFFLPLGLYGIYTENWIIAGVAWFFASFGSFTVVFLGGILSFVVAVTTWNLFPLFAILPAGLKLVTHFYPFLAQGNLKSALLKVMKSIGMIDCNLKYKFTSSKRMGIREVYFLFIYAQFFIATCVIIKNVPILLCVGIMIFLLNSRFVRFADFQSMQMLMFGLATAEILRIQEPWLLLSYWILISPLPLLVGFPSMRNVFDLVPKLAPFFIKKLIDDMENFLKSVEPGQRVLMVFDVPQDIREKIFDGYRVLLELPLYVSSKKGIHFMPDWWGVFELNYKGAPDFWGRSPNSVIENINRWKADYVVIYQDESTELEAKWKTAGFDVVSKFSWANHEKELIGVKPYSGETPDWWLLKRL